MRRPTQFSVLVGLTLLVSASRADYLPRTGGAKLRFLHPPDPGAARVARLPLPPPAASPTGPEASTAPPPPTSPVSPVHVPAAPYGTDSAAGVLPDLWEQFLGNLGPAAPGSGGPVPEAPQSGTPSIPAAQENDETVTPQMLLRFFQDRGGTGSRAGGLVVPPPAWFKPPERPGTDSTATYVTP
ncbi:MAG: hypothetical protein FJ387_12750 [Verrucomicrobia bacterium]|nr:hypothetical protein [Verrucomicrobiota bacterium]